MSAWTKPISLLTAAFCLWRVTAASDAVTAVYSDKFRDHYPKVGQKFDLNPYELEAPTVVWDSAHDRKITILRTRGDKYGYEQQKCVMTVEGSGLKSPRFLAVLAFRNVEASWITGKLIIIKLDIGHVAGVDAIYDVEGDKLIYCESVSYNIEDGAANGSQPIRPERQIDCHWRLAPGADLCVGLFRGAWAEEKRQKNGAALTENYFSVPNFSVYRRASMASGCSSATVAKLSHNLPRPIPL
jgi:hypothetical protein